jgi:hypothetical protein
MGSIWWRGSRQCSRFARQETTAPNKRMQLAGASALRKDSVAAPHARPIWQTLQSNREVMPRKSLHTSTAVLVASVLTQACGAGWHQPAQMAPGPLPARQQVQVWQRGRALQWHAVSVSSDSVTGIPFHKSADCDSCRLTMPRSQVDSLRLGNPTAGFWKTVGLVVGIPVLAVVVICSSDEGGPPCSD